MSFFGNLISAAVKTALTPIAVAKDAINVTLGSEVDSTKKLLESVKEDLEDAGDDLTEGNL